MEITIDNVNGKSRKIRIPTSPLSWNIIWKTLSKEVDEKDRAMIEDLSFLIGPLFRELKTYSKTNGSFVLVDLQTHEGTHVTVRT